MKNIISILIITSIVLSFLSCEKNNFTDVQKINYSPSLEVYDYNAKFEEDGVFFQFPENDMIALGRILFYDKKLSLNNSISCNSCHLQEFAFGDNKKGSFGFEDKLTPRNSPTIQNLGTSNVFFWDMSQKSLQTQVLIPFQNHIEMGIPDEEYLVNKVKSYPYYQELFKEQFDLDSYRDINADMISGSLAAFVKSITTSSSKFDDRIEQPLSAKEDLGREIFIESKCNDCHNVMPFQNGFFIDDNPFNDSIPFVSEPGPYSGGSTGDAANIGLDETIIDEGAGNGRFKIPTLRNLAFSAPYMHDGRFDNLDEVIEHYNSGIIASSHLDFRLRDQEENFEPIRLGLKNTEKEALKAFLLTLTDTGLLTEKMYSDPFKY